MTKWQRVFLVLVALATASGGYLFTSRRLSAQEAAPTANAQLVEVRRGNLTIAVTSSGSVYLPRQAKLSFGVAGTIQEILVTEGNAVKEKQPLARLADIPSFQAAVAQAQANVKQSQKNLEDARKQSPTTVPQAEQAVANARLSLQNAQDALADAQVIDPVLLSQREKAVATARVALQNAKDALDNAKVTDPVLLSQREQAVANARVTLQNAQDALDKAKVVDPVLLSQREQAVANARVTLQNAQEAWADAQKPFTDQELADAKAAVVSAQRTWDLAKQDVVLDRQTWDNKVKQAEDTYATALETYRTKVKAYWGAELTEAQALQDPDTVSVDPNVIFAWNYFLPRLDWDAINTSIRAAWQTLINARDNRDAQRAQRDKAIVAAEQAERQAGASLRKAQETLDNMVVDPLQVSLKQAQIVTAQANLQKALDDLAEVKKGPDPLDIALKQSQVTTDQANLQKALDDLAEIKKGPDPLDIALKQAQVPDAQANLQKALDDLAEVKKGPDPLVVALKKAQVAMAQASLQKALDDLEDVKAGPDPVLVELRQAQVASAQESLDTAQENLASVTLTAPFSGVINSISLKVGERVGANTVIMDIVDSGEGQVTATLDEVDMARVKPGQRVTVTMDALPGTRITGQVASLALLGTRTSGVLTYPLKVTMTVPSGVTLRDGLTATLSIVVAEKRGVLLVPTRALKRQGRDWVAQVMVNGKPEDRQVTVGANSDQMTEIVSGLAEGEQVLVAAATRSSTTQVPGGFGGGFMPGMPPGGFR